MGLEFLSSLGSSLLGGAKAVGGFAIRNPAITGGLLGAGYTAARGGNRSDYLKNAGLGMALGSLAGYGAQSLAPKFYESSAAYDLGSMFGSGAAGSKAGDMAKASNGAKGYTQQSMVGRTGLPANAKGVQFSGSSQVANAMKDIGGNTNLGQNTGGSSSFFDDIGNYFTKNEKGFAAAGGLLQGGAGIAQSIGQYRGAEAEKRNAEYERFARDRAYAQELEAYNLENKYRQQEWDMYVEDRARQQQIEDEARNRLYAREDFTYDEQAQRKDAMTEAFNASALSNYYV